MRAWAMLLPASLLAAGCSKTVSATAGCTPANCQIMLGTCNTELTDDPDYQFCLSSTPAVEDGGTPTADPDSCAQVCQADEEGVFVQCIASNASVCSGAGAPASLIDQCQAQQAASVPATVSARCDNTCQVTRAQCQGNCPLAAFAACYQCSLSCSLAAIACRHDCPPEILHCTDGVQDDGEEGVDCGGECGPCPESDFCDTGADCVSGVCTGEMCSAVQACAEAAPKDGGSDETIDAGVGGSADDAGPSDYCPNNTCLYGTCR